MRLLAAIEGRLSDTMAGEIAAAEKAVSAGVREGADGLKLDLRRQITSAGLGTRLANTWRSRLFPPSGRSIGAAGFVWSKAPRIVGVHQDGAVIRSTRGLSWRSRCRPPANTSTAARRSRRVASSGRPASGSVLSIAGVCPRFSSPTIQGSIAVALQGPTPASERAPPSPG